MARTSSRSFEERMNLNAYVGQPRFAVAVLAIRARVDVETGLAALFVPADDIEQAKGIGLAFLQGRWPEEDGWEYEIAVTIIHAQKGG